MSRVALHCILLNVLAMSEELLPVNHPSHQQKKCIDMKTTGEREHWNHFDCDFWTSRDRQGRLISDYRYRYLSYGALLQRMRALEYLYPELVTLQSAQEEYNLPVAGRYRSRCIFTRCIFAPRSNTPLLTSKCRDFLLNMWR